jgi:hypothetical protein
VSEKYDSSDLDAIKELRRSRGFELLAAKINAELERRRVEIEMPADWGVTNMARGKVSALRLVLTMPAILEHEIKLQVKK